MKSSFISVSNAMILSTREWIITLVVFAFISGVIYHGWQKWEYYSPGPDHRETCWAARQSDYWQYTRWLRHARKNHEFLFVGDSVIWGQEVAYDETITAFLNRLSGGQIFANLGNDGLFMAGINGIVRYYGRPFRDANVIVQLNPLWVSNLRRDLREDRRYRYHHPRLIPQFDKRIMYFHDVNTRMGYFLDNYFRIFPFVRHLMANYFDNTSISEWMLANPYMNPFKAVTFEAAPIMTEKQGRGTSWLERNVRILDHEFVMPSESLQYDLFFDALRRLQRRNANVLVVIGPFNHYMYTPESQETMWQSLAEAREELEKLGIPYFDTFGIGIESPFFADACHLLKEGHEIIARAMLDDPVFQEWMAKSK